MANNAQLDCTTPCGTNVNRRASHSTVLWRRFLSTAWVGLKLPFISQERVAQWPPNARTGIAAFIKGLVSCELHCHVMASPYAVPSRPFSKRRRDHQSISSRLLFSSPGLGEFPAGRCVVPFPLAVHDYTPLLLPVSLVSCSPPFYLKKNAPLNCVLS